MRRFVHAFRGPVHLDRSSQLLKLAAVIVMMLSAVAGTGFARGRPQAAVEGAWSPPYWLNLFPPTPAQPPFWPVEETLPNGQGTLLHAEVGHACVIPSVDPNGDPGPYVGCVLVWNLQKYRDQNNVVHSFAKKGRSGSSIQRPSLRR